MRLRCLTYILTKALVGITLLSFSASCSHDEETATPRTDVFSSLQDVGRLDLARMSVGKVGTITDPSFRKSATLAGKAEALVDKLKVGDRIAVYSYDTYLRASVDLTALTPDNITVDEENHTVELRLPPVKVELEGRDLTLREEHYRVSGMRSDISPAERARLKEQMNREVKKEISADPALTERLRSTAERRAVNYFTSLLADMGYEGRVTVTNR